MLADIEKYRTFATAFENESEQNEINERIMKIFLKNT